MPMGNSSRPASCRGRQPPPRAAPPRCQRARFPPPAAVLDLRGTCTTLVVDLAPLTVAPLVQALTLVPVVLAPQAAPKAERLLQRTLCTVARLQENADLWDRRDASGEHVPVRAEQ